jgi:hypothetical protein
MQDMEWSIAYNPLDNEKINEFQASSHLVHKNCGQGVEKYVHKPNPNRRGDDFYFLPNI